MSSFSLLKFWVVHSLHNLDESCGKNHVEFVLNPADYLNYSILSLPDLGNSENHKRFSMKLILLFEASVGKIMNKR